VNSNSGNKKHKIFNFAGKNSTSSTTDSTCFREVRIHFHHSKCSDFVRDVVLTTKAWERTQTASHFKTERTQKTSHFKTASNSF